MSPAAATGWCCATSSRSPVRAPNLTVWVRTAARDGELRGQRREQGRHELCELQRADVSALCAGRHRHRRPVRARAHPTRARIADHDYDGAAHHHDDYDGAAHHDYDYDGAAHHDYDYDGAAHHDYDYDGAAHHDYNGHDHYYDDDYDGAA